MTLKPLVPLAVPTILAAAILFPLAARADVIDGDWCCPDGRRFSIRGPEVLTAAGHHLQGDYSRHHFSYVVPKAERNAGQTVDMHLMNENTIYLTVSGNQSGKDLPVEIWHRCPPAVSLLRALRPTG